MNYTKSTNLSKVLCLEALDGGGKTTQARLIENYIKEKNLKYAYLHFPHINDNEAGTIIAAYLRGEYGNIQDVDPRFVASIFALNRFLFLPKLNKLIYENDLLLIDRYVFSSMAYEGAKFDNNTQSSIIQDWINEYEFGFLELPYPDLTIFLDVPTENIQQRLRDDVVIRKDRSYLQNRSDIHETNIEYLEKVRTNYLKLNAYQNFKVIEYVDGQSAEQTFEKYKIHLDILINAK